MAAGESVQYFRAMLFSLCGSLRRLVKRERERERERVNGSMFLRRRFRIYYEVRRPLHLVIYASNVPNHYDRLIISATQYYVLLY